MLATGPEAAQDLSVAFANVLGETLGAGELAADGSTLQAEGVAHTQAVAAITGIYHTVAGRRLDWTALVRELAAELENRGAQTSLFTKKLNPSSRLLLGLCCKII